MTTRERFQRLMRFEPVDRLPVVEWAVWWNQTVERWVREGLPPRESERYAMYRHFGLDMYRQDWFRACAPGCPGPAAHGAGIVKDDAGYTALLPFLYPAAALDEGRWRHWAVEQAAGESVLWVTFEGFFWFPRTLLGIEPHLYSFYDQPDLVHRINRDTLAWSLRLLDRVCRLAPPDFLTLAEDMSYNHGPMLSEAQFNEFLLPYYLEFTRRAHEHGIYVFVDSDGDVSTMIPWLQRAGTDGILPLERQAGVDVAALRRLRPDLRLLGAFDKMVMTRGAAAIAAEFERLLPVARQGGFIPAMDHQTPPGVSYRQFQDYVALYHEFAVRAAQPE